MTTAQGVLGEERIAEIEARANAATEGPWESGDFVVVAGEKPHHTQKVSVQRGVLGSLLPRDAAFIASSRTDIPALIASHRALAAVLQASAERLRRENEEMPELAKRPIAFRARDGMLFESEAAVQMYCEPRDIDYDGLYVRVSPAAAIARAAMGK